jgi:inosine-uridine nucleoside N-ribohydrolase
MIGGNMRTLKIFLLALFSLFSACLVRAQPSPVQPPQLNDSLAAPKTNAPANAVRRAIPVILDTDIGTDIDDTWALAQLLRSPELDPKLILTTSGGREYRSAIVAKFLAVAGRTDIPIGLGVKTNSIPAHSRNQEPWIKNYSTTNYAGEIVEDGVGRMIRIIEESSEPVTIIAIAPSGNLAAALARSPRIAAKCRLVGMFGSFNVGYSGGLPASAETNVRLDPAALRTVLAAPWKDVLLTPLDTCDFAVLCGENYHRIWNATDDPMLRAVIENYCIFAPRVDWMHCDFFTQHSTMLFDCVAVYLAYSENFVATENIRFRITDDGFTVRDEHGEFTARVALRWKDLPAFESLLTDRLLRHYPPEILSRPTSSF